VSPALRSYICQAIDQNPDIVYGNALYTASFEGHDQIVRQLLEKGADVNAQGGFYGNALYAASLKGHDQIVQQLLEKRADVNAHGGFCGNALYAASLEGYGQIVQQLLEKGADVNARGRKYSNALQAASYKAIRHAFPERGCLLIRRYSKTTNSAPLASSMSTHTPPTVQPETFLIV
jgi:ankyrin repeat protein